MQIFVEAVDERSDFKSDRELIWQDGGREHLMRG
jgi:hypothetical protein